MSIQTVIYRALAEDADLRTLLKASIIDPTQPAIYEMWAPNDAEMAYINLTYTTIEGNHWAKRETDLEVDVFTKQDSTNAEAIKNQVMKILDRRKIELEAGGIARIHYDSDGVITEPTPDVTHWNMTFSVFYFKNAESYRD